MSESKASSLPQPPAAEVQPGSRPGETAQTLPAEPKPLPAAPARKPEIGGPKGPEPTRYGDWEKGGRCIDF